MLDAFLRSLNPLALLESLLALWKDHVPDWIRKPIEAILWAGALLVLSWLTYINDQIATFGAIGYIVTGLLLTALLIWLAAGYRLLRATAPYPLLRSAASNAELLSSEERDVLRAIEYFAKRYIVPPHTLLKQEVSALRYVSKGDNAALSELYDVTYEYLLPDLDTTRAMLLTHVAAQSRGTWNVYELLAIYVSKYIAVRAYVRKLLYLTKSDGTAKYRELEASNKQLEDALVELGSKPEHRELQPFLDQYRVKFMTCGDC